MMQFTKVDEDAYDVRMNLDTIRRISVEMSYLDEDSRFDDVDERKQAIANGFKTAYSKFNLDIQPALAESSEIE
jgi:hypothetical protein